jgi:hypothetical protein
MKYHVRIYYDEKGSNVEYTTDTDIERIKEQFCELLKEKIPLIVTTKTGIDIINPDKVIFFEIKELKQDD